MRGEPTADPHGLGPEPLNRICSPEGCVRGCAAVHQIADWLEKLGMSEYTQRFAENRIDFSALPDLTDNDLKDLGVVLGDRRKLMRAIAKLDGTPEATVLMAKPPSTLSVAAMQGLPIAEEPSEPAGRSAIRDLSGKR